MIFSRQLLPKVLDGSKTQTRRNREYIAGRTYAVQPGRGQKAVARIKVLSSTFQRLGDITESDAVAEGFDSVGSFEDYWVELYGDYWPSQNIWRIEFELEATQ